MISFSKRSWSGGAQDLEPPPQRLQHECWKIDVLTFASSWMESGGNCGFFFGSFRCHGATEKGMYEVSLMRDGNERRELYLEFCYGWNEGLIGSFWLFCSHDLASILFGKDYLVHYWILSFQMGRKCRNQSLNHHYFTTNVWNKHHHLKNIWLNWGTSPIFQANLCR